MKSHKTIYVNPVPRQSVQGRDKQVYSFSLSSGQVVQTVPMKKTKEFGVGSEYQFLVDHRKGKLVTGLDTMIMNPFADYTEEQLRSELSLSAHWEKKRLEDILEAEQIKKQTYFELLDDVKEGTYTSEVSATIFTHRDLKNIPEPTFLQKFKIILYDRPNKFSSDTPRGRLAIELIENLPTIAKSKTVINSAYHDFYISEENEAEVEQMKKQEIVKEATYYLHKLGMEYTNYQKYMVASLLKTKDGRELIKGEVNPVTVNNTLDKYVISNTPQQMDNIQKFMKVMNLLKTPEGMENLHLKFVIQQAINTNVISIRDGFYIWHSKAGTPNVYKFTDYKKLFSLLKSEFEIFNEEDLETTNWYRDLLEEVKSKGVIIETA